VAFHAAAATANNLQLVIANDPDADIAAAASAAASAAVYIYAATATNLQLVIANDPDADRLAAAEQTMADGKGTGQFTTFSGNDIGLLLADWVKTNFRKQHPEVGIGLVLSCAVPAVTYQRIGCVICTCCLLVILLTTSISCRTRCIIRCRSSSDLAQGLP
jgi:phosphomannomutase